MVISALLLMLAQVSSADMEMRSDKITSDASVAERVATTFADEARKSTPQKLSADADAEKAKWDTCVKKFAENASIVDADSTMEVVEIALLACRSERQNAEIAWAKRSFVSSRYRPDMRTALKWAAESFDEFAASKKQSMPIEISLFRQLAELARERDQIRRDMKK